MDKHKSIQSNGMTATSPRVVQRLAAARALDASYRAEKPSPSTANNRDELANRPTQKGGGGNAAAVEGNKPSNIERFRPAKAGAILAKFNGLKHAQQYAGRGGDIQKPVPARNVAPDVLEYIAIAHDYAEEIYGYNDRDYFANFQLGYAHETRGEYLSAERHFRRAARTDVPDCWVDVVFHLATCLQRQGKVDEALTWYRKLKPSDVNSYIRNLDLEKASILLLQNELDAAIDIFEVLLLQHPHDGALVLSLATAYYQRGTAQLDTHATCFQAQYPVATNVNGDVAASIQLFWYVNTLGPEGTVRITHAWAPPPLHCCVVNCRSESSGGCEYLLAFAGVLHPHRYLENVVRSHPVEHARWKGGVSPAMQKDLCFLRHQRNWQDRRAAVRIQTRVRGVLGRAAVLRLRAELRRKETFGAVALRLQRFVRMALAVRLLKRMVQFRARHAVKMQALVRGRQGREQLRRVLESRGIVVFYFPLDVERVEFNPKTGRPEWVRTVFMQQRQKQLAGKAQRLLEEEDLRRRLGKKMAPPVPPPPLADDESKADLTASPHAAGTERAPAPKEVATAAATPKAAATAAMPGAPVAAVAGHEELEAKGADR
jgi:tetratricopeptide (TPR) repeat protein